MRGQRKASHQLHNDRLMTVVWDSHDFISIKPVQWAGSEGRQERGKKRKREPTLLMVYTVDERTLPDRVMWFGWIGESIVAGIMEMYPKLPAAQKVLCENDPKCTKMMVTTGSVISYLRSSICAPISNRPNAKKWRGCAGRCRNTDSSLSGSRRLSPQYLCIGIYQYAAPPPDADCHPSSKA